MEALLLLCDWAEEINGKLYIMGGGWERVLASRPLQIAVAVRLSIPKDQIDIAHDIELTLITEDGQPVSSNDDTIGLRGKVEVGRRPGGHKDVAPHAALAARFGGVMLSPGFYSFELIVDGQRLAGAMFEAVEGTL